MQFRIRIGALAQDDERFICVAHHAVLRRAQGQALVMIAQDGSWNKRAECAFSRLKVSLGNSSLIAVTKWLCFKCKLRS